MLLLILAGLALRRRRERVAALPAPELVEAVPAEEPPPVLARGAPAAARAPRMLDPVAAPPRPPVERARLSLALVPRRAGINLLTATAEVEIVVRNDGAVAAGEVRVDAALFAARAGLDEELARLFATRSDRPAAAPFVLEPGEERAVRTIVTLPRAAIRPLQAAGRDMFVPVVAVSVRYQASDDGQGQVARAFAVGVVREGTDKLGPLWLDAPVRSHDQVAARPHGLALDS